MKALILLFSLFAFSQEFIVGEGVFRSQEGDPKNFINRQLFNKAFQDIITKTLTSMNLSSELFWHKVDEKFKASFKGTREALKIRYSEKSQKDQLQKIQRYTRLKRKAKFTTFPGVITRFALLKKTYSRKSPYLKRILVKAKINRILLKNIYYKHVTDYKKKTLEKVFLNIQVNLQQQNLHSENINTLELSQNLQKYWLQWWKEQLPNITFESTQANIDSPPAPTENSAWMLIEINIKTLSSDLIFKEKKISWDYNIVLKDLTHDRPLLFTHEAEIPFGFNYENQKISKIILDHVYNYPLESFSKISRKMRNFSLPTQNILLKVIQFTNLSDVYDLMKLLKENIPYNQVQVELSTFRVREALLTLHYATEIDNLNEVLINFQGKKIGQGKLIFPEKDNRHVLSIIQESPVKELP